MNVELNAPRTRLPLPSSPAEQKARPLQQLIPSREGGFWVLLALAVPRLVGAVLTVLLRRFLGPGAAGVFDLAYTPYKLLDGFRNFGTGPALIYEQTMDRSVANTAWTLNMLAALATSLVAQLLAHPIAVYYGHPQIEPIFRVLSLAYLFAAVGSVHSFLLLRDRNFRSRSFPAIGQVTGAGCLAVLVALWGFGVGALVVREVASAGLGAILLWAIYPFRPRIQLVPSIAIALLRYGIWIGAGLTILYMSQNADIFIGGRIIRRTGDIGFYTTSWSLAFIVAGVCTLVAGTMVFPALSRLQHDLSLLTETLLRGMRQVGLVMLPAAALLAAVAPVLIVPLLGDKFASYRSSFLVLSVLALYAGIRTMLFLFFEGYKAVGKPWLIPAYHAVKLAVMVPAMIVGAQHGILGLALTYIPIQLLELPAALLLAQHILEVSPSQIWRALRTPLTSTLLMVLAVVTVETVLPHLVHAGDALTLLACLLVAGVVYLGTLLVLDRSILHEARGVILKGL